MIDSRTACVILAFNRVEYLRESLFSIRKSILQSDSAVDVYMFQDSAYNALSNTQRALPSETLECQRIFESLFKVGEFIPSPSNLGICQNFERAEKFVFEKKQYTSAIFFEDDMIVHPWYLSVLLPMLEQAKTSVLIGNVAAYGANHRLSEEEQVLSRDEIQILDHSWAFGLTRRSYVLRKQYMDAYHRLFRSVDYFEKDVLTDKIHEIHHNLGFLPNVLSQDMMKCMANHRAGLVNVNTVAVLGKYIGRVGVHYTSEVYESFGFGQTVLYPSSAPMPRIDLLDYVKLAALYKEQAEFRGCKFKGVGPLTC